MTIGPGAHGASSAPDAVTGWRLPSPGGSGGELFGLGREFATTLVGATTRNGPPAGSRSTHGEQREPLQGLPKTHVVGEDSAQPLVPIGSASQANPSCWYGRSSRPSVPAVPRPGRTVTPSGRQQALDLLPPRRGLNARSPPARPAPPRNRPGDPAHLQRAGRSQFPPSRGPLRSARASACSFGLVQGEVRPAGQQQMRLVHG